ncbi:hypothetical protein Zmor_001562 [Zophobas morio]|uniref:Ricin B lectin domain-containing protein n=1 Tax=Zophobas morio TaxID=2755281 RepID=A0AA38IYP6_9CUCU|nr:hypothetical protein Zmor_001562 [Zophobas morio]
MKHFQRSVSIFFLLWTVIVAQECYLDRTFYIKAAVGGLSLDGSYPDNVKVIDYNGQAQQRWIIECGDQSGHFFIVNAYNGLVLDVQNLYVVLKTKSSSVSQQWTLNWNSTIFNVGYNRNMDIYQGDFVSGNNVLIYQNSGLPQQIWNLQEV